MPNASAMTTTISPKLFSALKLQLEQAAEHRGLSGSKKFAQKAYGCAGRNEGQGHRPGTQAKYWPLLVSIFN